MRIGLIAEGASDLEVLVNILKGQCGLDRADVMPLRPDLSLDETDLAQLSADTFSNWEIVKQECVERLKIDDFLTVIDEERLLIVQLDTAECELPNYGVRRPASGDAVELVAAVWAALLEWLATRAGAEAVLARLRAAVCVEEMDAWVLAIHEAGDSCAHHDPKRRLDRLVSKDSFLLPKERKRHFQLSVPQQYAELSKPLRKRRDLERAAGHNVSLRLFLRSLPDPE